MNFYQPNLLLIRNEQNDYILYSTIYWNNLLFQAHGDTVNIDLNNNLISVGLILKEDASFLPQSPDENFELIYPITHLINLGPLTGVTLNDADELSATIEATIFIEHPIQEGMQRRGERGSVGTVSAGGNSRPFIPGQQ